MKYKVGDWVKVVKDEYVPERVGMYGRIVEIDGGALEYKYILANMPRPHMGGQSEEEILPCCQHGKVEGEECHASGDCKWGRKEVARFKVGDRVRFRTTWGKHNRLEDEKTGVIATLNATPSPIHAELYEGMPNHWGIKLDGGMRGDGINGEWMIREDAVPGTMEKIEEPVQDYGRLYFSDTPKNYWGRGISDLMQEIKYEYNGEFPRKESFMQKLSNLPQAIRRAFDKDQKALYRAGYIDQHGEWTDKAHNEAREDFLKKYLNDNKAEFVERANEAIELAKEEECD